MRGASLVLLVVLGPAIPTQVMPAQSKGLGAARISNADINDDGSVRIEFKTGRSIRIPMVKGQAGRDKLQVAVSGKMVGWLEVDGPVGSYSVPTTLTVYTVGKPLRHFSGYRAMLLDWGFIDDDRRIQFSSSAVHGRESERRTVEVLDLATGRLVERWSDGWDSDVTVAEVRGMVTSGDGVPLPDTVVSSDAALTTSDEHGHFVLRGISPGQHELRLEHPRFKGRAIQIAVGSSGEAVEAGSIALERQPRV